jgi:protein-S-isoprenylcysteine O-methyltransferase Ste14
MKTKSITILVFISLVYIFPLIGYIYLVFTAQIGILIFLCIILLITQPSLRIQEAETHRKNDKNSVWFIHAAGAFGQIIIVMEWAYFRSNFHHWHWDGVTILGLLLMSGGLTFRIWSIYTLGKFFTASVQIQTGQVLIQYGPYRIIRHPSYLGAYASIVGSSLFMHSYLCIVISAILMWIVYDYRIAREEDVLINTFGRKYESYQQHTKRMFPLLW